MCARLDRSVEPVEDQVDLGVGDPRPAVGHGKLGTSVASADAHLDRTPGGVELARVVEEARDRSLDGGLLCDHRHRRCGDGDLATAATSVAGRDLGCESCQVERFDGLVGGDATRHGHDLVHEIGQLDRLGA